ncbi:MAG: DUF1667 domain-containing protein [Thermoplasmatota archaeon]
MTKEHSVVCIMCPLGCEVKVEVTDGEITDIQGYACENGKEYAEQEISSPTRTVMSVVKCKNGNFPTVSVKTSEPVRKEKIYDVMKSISRIEVEAPVSVGDTIVKNVCGSGVDVVATRRVKKIQE